MKGKETAAVQELATPPSDEPRQKTDSGKSTAARGKTEPKVIKQEPAASPDMTAGKPTAAASASQVTTFSDDSHVTILPIATHFPVAWSVICLSSVTSVHPA